jgi:hypothetical protein
MQVQQPAGKAQVALMETAARQVIAIRLANQNLETDGDSEDGGSADIATVKGFLSEPLAAWLATSPTPIHLVTVLSALAILKWRTESKEVKEALTSLLSRPQYLWYAASHIPLGQKRQKEAEDKGLDFESDGGDTAEQQLTKGNLLSPLVAVTHLLGLKKCLGQDGLKSKRIRELLAQRGVKGASATVPRPNEQELQHSQAEVGAVGRSTLGP